MILKKIGITGASGMVGRHMKALLDFEGIDYVELDRNVWDLSEWMESKDINDLLHNVDAFIHIGAAVPSPSSTLTKKSLFDINVRSCVAVAEWAMSSNIPVAYLSGATVYSDPHAENIHEDDAKTTNNFGGFYGFTKYLGEQVFSHYSHSGLRAVILRPSSIYGAGMGKDSLVASFLSKAEHNQTISIQPPSTNTVNFIHAYDVVNALLISLKNEAWGIYNIAAAQSNSIERLAKLCVLQSGLGAIKYSENDQSNDFTPFDRFDLNYDKATQSFSYAPQVSLEDGLKLLANGTCLVESLLTHKT